MNKRELTRREFLKLGGSSLAGAAVTNFTQHDNAANQNNSDLLEKNPNLIFIMADQLRACSIGCYLNNEVSTPNIDQIASEGVQFTQAISTSPICTPFRGCLITGRYPNATTVIENDIKLPAEEICIGELFKEDRYRTGYIGKWHLDGPTPDMISDPGWVAPVDRQGFQKWVGFNCAHLYYGGQYYENFDPTLKTIPVGIYEPDFQTDQAIDFINQYFDRPFCLFLSLGPPHTPSIPPDTPPGGDYVYPYDPDSLSLRPNVDYPDLDYARQEYADYYGMISNFDWNVGRIKDTLDTLGISESTILVITSDHGDSVGSHYSLYNTFRKKGRIEAECLDVPLILRYPRKINPGVIDKLFTSVDIMPTLLGLCRIPSPVDVMGRDFSPTMIRGSRPIEPPYGDTPTLNSALVGIFAGPWVGLRTKNYSLACRISDYKPLQLYHNSIDPYQMTNFVDDPAHQQIKDDLHQELLAWLDYVRF